MHACKGTCLPVAAWRCSLLPQRLGLAVNIADKSQHGLLATSLHAALECSLLCCRRSPVGLQVASSLLPSRRSCCHAAACYAQEAVLEEVQTLRSEACVDSAGSTACECSAGGLSSEMPQPSRFCVVNFYHLTSVEQPFKACTSLSRCFS